MRGLLLWVALAVVSVRPLAAETFLYATAATPGRIDGFRVLPDGSLSAAPVKQQSTAATFPRRIIARGCNLYVAESDRVEVFRLHGDGSLERRGATRRWDQTRAHDIELSADGKMLYVPVRRQNAIAAYPLDDDGLPNFDLEAQGSIMAGGPAGCVYSPKGADWEDIEVANGKLYATYSGRIEVYGIVDGKRCSNNLAKACTTATECTEPVRCITPIRTDPPQCSNNKDRTCTVDADCIDVVRCIDRRCSTNSEKPCEFDTDCDFRCIAETDNGARCANDLERTCTSDTDCKPCISISDTDCKESRICAAGQLVGSERMAKDGDDENTTIEAGETVCRDSEYSNTPAARTLPCVEKINDFPDNQLAESCPFSNRTHIEGIGLKVDGTTLVVSTRFTHRLLGFTLQPDGNFPPIYSEPTDPDSKDGRKIRKKQRRLERKCRKRNRTDEFIRYIGLTLHRPANETPLLFATGFSGRTDAFRLDIDPTRKPNPDPVCDATDSNCKDCDDFEPPSAPKLSRQPGSHTPKNVISTPTRTVVGTTAQGRGWLYVAAGELDRVQAFRLFAAGGVDSSQSPVETDELKGSFPNDVVLVDISNCD